MASTWNDMLDEFRALGGTAENICLKEGRLGRGLFPCDPSKPIQVHAPESLLVDTQYIAFNDDDSFRWHDNAPIGPRERAFLEAYQRDFSWGVDRGNTEALLRILAEAPQELSSLLASPFKADLWLDGPTKAAVRERYFGTRYITYKGRGVLMPVVELVNHSHTPVSFDREDGIGVSGIFDGEILVRYSFADALDIFSNWGFASEGQPFALSLELSLETEAGEIVIERNDIDTDPKRRPFYPDVKVEGSRVRLSYMMLGHKDYPKLAKANFYRIMRNAGRSDAQETFDKISQINRSAFLKLMAVSEQAAPQAGKLIRDVARIQLEAMAYAVGTREL
jgi:hypothetical protein